MTEETKKERKAIEALQKVFDKWPKSLWLFSNGTLFVMKTDNNGNYVMKKDTGGIDQSYVVTSISNVHSEGGDW